MQICLLIVASLSSVLQLITLTQAILTEARHLGSSLEPLALENALEHSWLKVQTKILCYPLDLLQGDWSLGFLNRDLDLASWTCPEQTICLVFLNFRKR